MSKIKSLQDIANKYPAASLGKRANLLEIKKDIAQALKDIPDQEIKNIIIALSDIYRKMPEGDSKLVLAFMMANIQSEKPHKYIDKIIEIHEKNEERKKQRDKEEGEKRERERAERVRREQEEEARAQAAAEEKQRQEDEKKANKGKRRRETKQGRKDTAKDFGSRFYNKDKKTDTNNQQNTNNNQQNNNQNRGQQNRQQRNTGNNQQNTNNNQQNTHREQEKQYNYSGPTDQDIRGMNNEDITKESKKRFRILIRLVHPDKSRGDEKLERLLNQISKDLNNINGMKDIKSKLQYLRNFEKVHKELLEKLRNQNTNTQEETKQEESKEEKKKQTDNKEQQTKETLKDKTIEVQGQKIPAMGFGLRTIGTDNKAKEIIHNAIKNGYTSFDTAQEYGNEEILAEQVQKSGIARDKFFITSKLSPSRHVYGGRNFSQEIFYKKIQQTAKQMGGYIDVMMLHSWLENQTHRHMAYDALIQAKKEGLIKNIGVSNYTGEQLQDAIKYLGDKGEKILVNQVEASVFLKDKINMRQNAAVCTKEDIAIVAYSPLRGIEQLDDPNNTLHKTHIDEIAKKHNITRAQVALAYLANIGYIVIPSSTNPKRQQENLQTPIIKLTPEEIKSLEEISIVTGEAQNNIEYFNNK